MPTVLSFRALNMPKNAREHAGSVGEDQCLGIAFAYVKEKVRSFIAVANAKQLGEMGVYV
ncbi:hypothetical protein P5673_012049 [Acropora cervicornis]|uniref:Uncharacterized protein n=1 Tax=Acropora cervicornis TaxID=6130 RepID=A0AAD9V7X9_ACRCE|nr:hypothetical protein P5673_012049 [Acropora cervicornis]